MSIEARRQERVIDGVTYSVVPLPVGAGLKALDRFKNVAAPLLAAGIRASKNLEEAAADALRSLPSQLSYNDIEFFQGVFGDTSVYIDGQKRVPLTAQIQELHFVGRYMALFDWLAFCMEVNFAGFFGELKKRASGALAQAKGTATNSTSAMMTGLSSESSSIPA